MGSFLKKGPQGICAVKNSRVEVTNSRYPHLLTWETAGGRWGGQASALQKLL